MLSPPEEKHLKRYGLVNLRTFKPTNRLGFQYFEGKHLFSGKHVFIKTDPSAGQAATREATLLKILNGHPRQVLFPQLIAHKARGRFAFVATEFIPGASLDRFLAKHPPLTEPQINFLLNQFQQILKILQSNKIIHRDIRPQNLMVRLKRGKPFLVLIDFSFAVALEPNPLPELPFLLTRQKFLRRLGGRYRAAADHWDDAYSMDKIAQQIDTDYRCKYPLIGQFLHSSIGRLTFPCSET